MRAVTPNLRRSGLDARVSTGCETVSGLAEPNGPIANAARSLSTLCPRSTFLSLRFPPHTSVKTTSAPACSSYCCRAHQTGDQDQPPTQTGPPTTKLYYMYTTSIHPHHNQPFDLALASDLAGADLKRFDRGCFSRDEPEDEFDTAETPLSLSEFFWDEEPPLDPWTRKKKKSVTSVQTGNNGRELYLFLHFLGGEGNIAAAYLRVYAPSCR